MATMQVKFEELAQKIGEIEKSGAHVSEIHRIDGENYSIYFYNPTPVANATQKPLTEISVQIKDIAHLCLVLRELLEENNSLAACLDTASSKYDAIFDKLYDAIGAMCGINDPQISNAQSDKLWNALDCIVLADYINQKDFVEMLSNAINNIQRAKGT